jgi:hypothetical protein
VNIIRLDTGTLCGDWKLQRKEKHIICNEDVFDSIDICFYKNNIYYINYFLKDSSYVNACIKICKLKYMQYGKPNDGWYTRDSTKVRMRFVSDSYKFRKMGHLVGYKATRHGYLSISSTNSNGVTTFTINVNPGAKIWRC